MKLRFVCFLLIFTFAASLFSACANEPEDTLSVVSFEESSEETRAECGTSFFYDDALAYIKTGKYKNAFEVLSNISYDFRAKELLKDFKVLPKKIIDPEHKNGFIEYIYDEKGNVTKTSDSEDTSKYYYDEKGNLVKHEKTDAQGVMFCTLAYEYDENGLLVKEQFNERDSEIIDSERITTYTYFDNGLLKTKMISDGSSKLYSDSTYSSYVYNYEYDENGKLVKSDMQYKVTGASETITYEYDESNRLVREYEVIVREGRSSYSETRYTYNEKGNLTEKYNDTTNSRTYNYYEYDTLSQLAKETIYPFPNYKTFITYEYDCYGYLVKKNILDEETNETTVVEYQYEYLYVPKV